MRAKKSGQVWGVVRLKVHVDVMAWLKESGITITLSEALMASYWTHWICDIPPEEDLPPTTHRAVLETSIPIEVFEVVDWWARTKGVLRAKLIRAILTEAYYDAKEKGFAAPIERE